MNLGNPREFTILDLAKKVIELTGSKSEIIYNPLPDDDPKRHRTDISLAQRLLDWEPRIGLEEGLEKAKDICQKYEFQLN